MREIKFKKWDKEYKEITYFDGKLGFSLTQSSSVEYLQYTGLKDINGVEIYEGDIVEYFEGEYHNGCYQYQGVIMVDFDIKTLNDLHNSQNLKVIGNIYENPELLED